MWCCERTTFPSRCILEVVMKLRRQGVNVLLSTFINVKTFSFSCNNMKVLLFFLVLILLFLIYCDHVWKSRPFISMWDRYFVSFELTLYEHLYKISVYYYLLTFIFFCVCEMINHKHGRLVWLGPRNNGITRYIVKCIITLIIISK